MDKAVLLRRTDTIQFLLHLLDLLMKLGAQAGLVSSIHLIHSFLGGCLAL